MKPYPRNQSLLVRSKSIFNYRLSRARRIVENAFGILTHRFRIFCTPIHLNVETVGDTVTCACILHNILIDEKVQLDRYSHIDNESQLEHLNSIESFNETEPQTQQPIDIRNEFKNYFNTIGAVSWQNETIRLQ